MNLIDFKREVRLCRGKLTKHDEDLEVIFEKGIPALHNFILVQKQMGVANVRKIAESCSYDEQYRFCKWMAEKGFKASKNEVELFFHTLV